MAPPRIAPALPALLPVVGAAMRTPLKRLATRLVERLPEGPEPDARRAASWMIVCEARPSGGGDARRGVISGADVYGLTAATIALSLGIFGFSSDPISQVTLAGCPSIQ